jgi:hypothetical protein
VFAEKHHGPVVLAVETELVAAHLFGPARLISEDLAGTGRAADGVVSEVVVASLAAEAVFGDLVSDSDLFEALDAHLTPTGYGHGLDELDFDGGFGGEFLVEAIEEPLEPIVGFAFENDGSGEEAVNGAVEGGVDFAPGGQGAAGFFAVSARGGGLFLQSSDFFFWLDTGTNAGGGVHQRSPRELE